MIFSLSVDPHWLKKSDRFWYMYETTEGKKWYIVDPAKGEKKVLFDNADLAAKITRIVKDPFDAQHLGLDSMGRKCFLKRAREHSFLLELREIGCSDGFQKFGRCSH